MKLRRVKLLAAVCCVLWTMASAAAEPSLAELLAEPVPQAANDGIEVAPPAEEDIQAPEGGWGWDELARRAGQRADEAKVQFIRAAAKRQQLDGDLSWKDPQLRLGQSWDDTRDRTTGRPPANGDGDSFKAGLRFYIANPFVNRYVRRAGDARIEALEARAKTAQYAVYCEVKSLCLEEERLRREQRRRSETSDLWERVRICLEHRLEKGVMKSPLDALHAEVAREKARAQADEALVARRQVRRQIAFYTGIPERKLQIRYTPPEPPSTNKTFVAALWSAAFARRPDLVGARAELAAARADVGAAKAAYLPWFDFVEGSYAHSTSSEMDWSGSRLKRNLMRGHSSGRSDEWQIRVAFTLPVFTWFGSSVKESQFLVEANDVRLRGLQSALYNEIETAMDDYCAADARFTRLSETGSAFVKRMQARIDEFAKTSAVRPDDICRAQLELLDYRKFKDEAEYDWVSRILLLETVSGGPLPYGAGVKPAEPEAQPAASPETAK